MQGKNQNTEQDKQFYRNIDLRKFHKQRFRNGKLNRHCEHVIRYGRPVTLTQEQRKQLIQNICDIPDNPICFSVFLGMAAYACMAVLLVTFAFAVSSALSQISRRIALLLFSASTILLLLLLSGFLGLCILITAKNRKRADKFRAETREKISRGDYRSYAYQIEEIYRVPFYDEGIGHLHFWYRVGDVIFELPNSAFAYHLHNNETVYEDPEQLEIHESNHPIGGYIIGILIDLDGRERFYTI